MGKKGLSFEDKRKKMLEIFNEDQSFFHFKDIEKLAIKKGITFQTVKEVLDSLVADNLVEADKIGSSWFYWALPSKIFQVKQATLQRNYTNIQELEQQKEELEEKIREANAARKETKERKEKLSQLKKLNTFKEDYSNRLNDFKKNDPIRYQSLSSDTKLLITMSDVCKDGIYSIHQWLRTKNPDANIVDMFPEVEKLNLFD